MTVKTYVHNGTIAHIGLDTVLAQHAHWLLRIGLAGVFLFHGLQKFFLMGIDGFAAMMGLPLAATVRGRLGDSATRLAGVAIVPVMIGAIAMVHWGRWSFTSSETHPMGGMEFQVVLLLMGLYFALRGNDA